MLKALGRLFRTRGPAPARAPPPQQQPRDSAALLAPAQNAAAAGRRRDAIALLEPLVDAHPDFAEAHLLLGKLLHAEKNLIEANDALILAACHRPEWPEPHLRLGLVAFDAGRYADALAALEKATELGGDGVELENALGAAYTQLGEHAKAFGHLERAVAIDPEFAAAQSNLGYALFKTREDYEAGARHIERALKRAPGDPAVLSNWAMVLHYRGQLDEARRIYEALLAHDPDLPEPRLNRALILLLQHDFERGWDDYEARKRLPGGPDGAGLPWPDWDGSPLAGRTIYVYREQGLGDDIMFASCVPDVLRQAGLCAVECHSKLEKLFRRSFAGAEVVTRATWRDSARLSAKAPDCKVAAGSLPLRFRRSRGDFPREPYLRADPERVAFWRAKLDALPGRKKVGISWRGGTAGSRLSLRSIPLDAWRPILELEGIDFVSLQYSDPGGELGTLRAAGLRLHEWQEAIEDYDETAALVTALDLVVSVQTAIVHLAGALGRPAWVLIPNVPEWRYAAAGHRMVWYESVRLIRQTRAGDWHSVLGRVRRALETGSEVR